MKRFVRSLATLMLVASCAFAETPVDLKALSDQELSDLQSSVQTEISERLNSSLNIPDEFKAYNPDFDFSACFRHPDRHFGEKYIISGEICINPNNCNTKDGGYKDLWIALNHEKVETYIVMDIPPMGFNLIMGDWLEVYATITGFDVYILDHKTFYVTVEGMNVFDKENGTLIDSTFAE